MATARYTRILLDISSKPALTGLNTAQLKDLVVQLGEKPFRAKQLASQLYTQFAQEFSAMSDLSAAFRANLEAGYQVNPLHVSAHRTSTDGVEKLLVHSGDENVFECVLLPYPKRLSCCLSTQVGCPMACTFCATGLGGFNRNLSVGDIVGQFTLLQSLSSRRIDHVVFMGMGEPLLNFDNLMSSIEILTQEIGLSMRHITVSTVGIVPQIRALAKLNLPIHLALSLHSPLDDVRSRLMPVNSRWDVAETVEAMRQYQKITGRKVTFEYLLIQNVNDSDEQAIALAKLVRGFPHVVNIIPWNWVDTGQGFTRPTRQTVRTFKAILDSQGVNVTERVERGHDIAAACGQLAGQFRSIKAKSTLTVAPRHV